MPIEFSSGIRPIFPSNHIVEDNDKPRWATFTNSSFCYVDPETFSAPHVFLFFLAACILYISNYDLP